MSRLTGLTGLAANAALGVSLLTACGGGGDGGDFCSQLSDDAKDLRNLDATDSGAIKKLTSEVKKLRDAAPDELKDAFDSLGQALEGNLSADVGQALSKIQTYGEDHCDVTLSPPS